MKALLSLLLICFVSLQSFADCAGSGIWAWPQTETISENPVIYIEGYFMDQETVRKIGKEYALYLVSPSHMARLEVIEVLEGEMHLTQVMLKPIATLQADVEYVLSLSSIPKKSTNSPKKLDLNFPDSKWTVKARKDKTLPLFTSSPTWVSSKVIYYGCGPSNRMAFEFKTNKQNNFLIRTTLTNTADKSQSTYYLAAKEGIVSVGHGMCSGAFTPREGVKYKLEFSLLDASWNKGKSASCEVVYKNENSF
ncbi:MAG: hypothetical protein P8I55_00370 [Crocinitomix sp.]|nr:hypothetical protein [Crocinitomix sp.]